MVWFTMVQFAMMYDTILYSLVEYVEEQEGWDVHVLYKDWH